MRTQLIILFGIPLLGFIFTKNKYLNLILCFLAFSLFAYSQDDFDYWAYQTIYEKAGVDYESGYEVAYVWLNQLSNIAGIKYETFRAIVGLIYVVPLYFIIRKLTFHPNVVWGAMVYFPTMFDSTLLRNSIAMVITIIGICYLIKLNKPKSIKSYVVPFSVFCIAALFHSSYWVMLAFIPLWWYVDCEKKYVLLIGFILLMYVFFSLNSNLIFNIYSKFNVREATIDKYQTGHYANVIGMAYNAFKYVLLISPVLIFRKNNKSFYPANTTSDGLMKNALKLNLIFSLILIPQSFATNFSRLFRILTIFNYVYIANHIGQKKMLKIPRLFELTFAIMLMLLLLMWESPTTIIDILYMHLTTNTMLN